MVEYLTRFAPSVNVNQLNKSGGSPLALTIALNHLDEANTLLNLGADPSLYQDYPSNEFPSGPFTRIEDKIKMTEEKIKKITEKLANSNYKEKVHEPNEIQQALGFSL